MKNVVFVKIKLIEIMAFLLITDTCMLDAVLMKAGALPGSIPTSVFHNITNEEFALLL